MLARVFVTLQYILPRFWLTSLVYRIARIRQPAIKDFLISKFVRLYKVRVDEVRLAVPDEFATFNDFFIRELDASSSNTGLAISRTWRTAPLGEMTRYSNSKAMPRLKALTAAR